MEQSEFPVFFGDWLKQRRKSLDLTQEELAQRAGCSVFALRKIESGERRPSKQLAQLLAGALAIPGEERERFVRAARGDSAVAQLRAPAAPPAGGADLAPHPGAGAHRLPAPATALLGRERELEAMDRIFAEPRCRLLTLTGLGGIGKTRLAIEFAARQSGRFCAVYYVPLAPLSAPELIVPAIADVVGLSFSGPTDPKEQLLRGLAERADGPTLLALDNVEHLLTPPEAVASAGAAGLVAEILQRLPQAKVLATSRERLNLQEEWTYEIHGLPAPAPDAPGALEGYPAVSLFIQAAQRGRPDFAVALVEEAALAEICRMLEGVPLALELAAGWVAVLSCEEIAREIACNLDFLQTSLRNVPERHRSLRATFDHSWRLLPVEERAVLMRLAAFRGGFDRSAAAQIAGASLPLLASLAAKSLIRRTENGRYDLHEVIRQYLQAHLRADGGHAATLDAHAAYYLGLVRTRADALKSREQQAAVRELTNELDNIRAAWVWSVERGLREPVEEALRGWMWLLETSGLHREGVRHFDLLLIALRAGPSTPERQRLLGQALSQQSMLLFRQGLLDEAQVCLEEGVALLRPFDEPGLLADGLIYLGVISHLKGDLDRSQTLAQEALSAAQACGSRWFAAFAVFNLGYLDSLRGRHEEGLAQMAAGMDLWRELGDPGAISMGLNHLGPTLTKLGRYEEARAGLEESLALCALTRDRWGAGTAHRYLGLLNLAQGEYDAAQRAFRKSLDVFQGVVIGWDVARTLSYMGETALAAGNAAEARTHFLEALRVAQEAKSPPLVMDATVGLAQLEALAGRNKEARQLALDVLNHRASTLEARERAERIRAAL